MIHSFGLLFVSVGFALAIMFITKRMNLIECLLYKHIEALEIIEKIIYEEYKDNSNKDARQ